ncbi:alpha/beta-hydrolase [Pyrenochaeta sp. DS3sAY3a]|nr:alpha/beta-hydrolase [Pyrenochaeta sp. DS3sAY3a]
MPTFTLETEHGQIHITDTGLQNSNPALLLIHGNTSSSTVFRHITGSPVLSTTHRIIAFDLPGHGSSSNAPDPQKSYWMRGYADLAVHILAHLRVTRVVVFGWSLGGHVGIEMVPLLAGRAPPITLAGLMLTGSPPVLGKAQIARGFRGADDGGLGLAGKEVWSPQEQELFARHSAAAGKPELYEPWVLKDAQRTDGRARVLMTTAFAEGRGVDQRAVVEGEKGVRVAVVNGADEPFVDLDYLDGLAWGRLWGGKCIRIEGCGHAPFWEKPEEFEGILVRFLGDCAGD